MGTDGHDLLLDIRHSIEQMEQCRLLAPLSVEERVFYNWLLSREQELVRSTNALAMVGTPSDELGPLEHQATCGYGYRERLERIWPVQQS